MASTRASTYAADEVTVIFAGALIDSGYAEGEFVSVEPSSDDFSSKAGADGEVARSKNLDRRSVIKLKLLQTSLGNNFLTQIRNADLGGVNGAGVGVFQIIDRSSGVRLAHADKAWIQKPPTLSRQKEIVEYEWTLEAGNMILDYSGNPSI